MIVAQKLDTEIVTHRSSRKRKSDGLSYRSKRQECEIESPNFTYKIIKGKQIMKLIDKEQPITYEKVGARLKRIVEAKKETSKFTFICMEIIQGDYFLAQPDDVAA